MPRAFYRLWHAGQKKPRQIHKNFALRENLLFDLFDFKIYLLLLVCLFLALLVDVCTVAKGLQVTFWVLPKAGIFSTKVQSKNEW